MDAFMDGFADGYDGGDGAMNEQDYGGYEGIQKVGVNFRKVDFF